MKKLIVLFTCLLLSPLLPFPLMAQSQDEGPLAESRVLRDGGGDEIIGFIDTDPWGDRRIVVSKYFPSDKDTLSGAYLDVLTFLMPDFATNWWGLEDPYNYDLITLNNDNELYDVVAAWTDHDYRLQLVALRADPNRLSNVDLAEWEKERWRTVPHTSLPSHDGVSSRVLLASGDFTGDGTEEFVLAFWSDYLFLSLGLYEINDSLDITHISNTMDQYIIPPLIGDWGTSARFTLYDITTGDLNGDGKDEILLVGREERESGGWNLFANVYSYEPGNNTLARILKDTLLTVTDDLSELINVNVISGYLNSEESQQAIVDYSLLNLTEENVPESNDLYMVALAFDESFSQITQSAPYHQIIDNPDWYNARLALKSADINGNGFEEIFSAYGKPYETYFRVYQLSDEIEFIEYANLDSLSMLHQFGINDLGFGNVIPDTTGVKRSPELIISYKDDHQQGPSIIYKINTDESGSFQGLTPVGINYSGPISSITTADLDGDIRLGKPKRSRITDIVQPLVILNAPPTHFDIFDGVPYDVNLSYFPNSSQFIATYEVNTEQTIEIETEFHRDWGVSAEISAGGGIKGFSVSGYLRGSYGEQFSERGGSSTTVSVNQQANAIVDDMIYAAIVDYELWEYPVLANGIKRGNILVVDPGYTSNAWFPSKSWTGYSYVPNHEVGNILSYRNYPDFSGNPMLDKKIKGDHNTFFVLGENTSYSWGLKWEEVERMEEIQSHDYSIEMGAEVSKWGVTLAVDGHYAAGEINTQRSSMSEGLSMNIQLAGIDVGLGEVSYRVIPYTYWADNGALVLDYAVQPEMAQPGYTPTWWQNRYSNKPDAAFILPWRYDPDKNRRLEDPAKRYQTHDITFFPTEPDEGDIVTITARVHNFSLLPTPSPVGVSFYVGDPDNGGTLITGEGNETIVYTDGAIPDRGRKEVQMKWRVPDNIVSLPRIYALIYPEQRMEEIHINNNKGWNVLGKRLAVSIEDRIAGLPEAFALQQNYPNPFNPGTNFEFSIPTSGMVILKVYNVLGQRVATLVSGHLNAGTHTFYWNASGQASGLYFYRLSTSDFTQTKKMLLVK